MKKYLLTAVFILAVASAAVAQVKQFTSNDFYKSESAAYDLMSGVSKRVVTKTETFENGRIINVLETVAETLEPDRYRFVRTEKKGDVETHYEIIQIADMEYTRINKGAWTAKKIEGSGMGSGTGAGYNSCKQYTEEPDFVGGQTARKLRELRIMQSEKGLNFEDSINWYNQQGQFLRTETVKGLLEPRIENYREVVTYEYEPNIKIEAPIK